MLKMGEGAEKVQIIVLVMIAIALTGALYFTVYKAIADDNAVKAATLESRIADVTALRPYGSRIPEMERQIESLREQLAVVNDIVPEEKAADEFMHVMQDTADSSGVEVRRYTARPITNKDFYTEVPFDIELDGSYYSMLNFFDRVSKLERIVNVTNLQVGAVNGGSVHETKSYQLGPGESVIATCTTSTFFSNESSRLPSKGKKKGGDNKASANADNKDKDKDKDKDAAKK
jgi:type IV pilus assembly protein PilO